MCVMNWTEAQNCLEQGAVTLRKAVRKQRPVSQKDFICWEVTVYISANSLFEYCIGIHLHVTVQYKISRWSRDLACTCQRYTNREGNKLKLPCSRV